MKRKLFALTLVVCVLLGCLNFSALAETEEPVEIIVWKRMFETWNQDFFKQCAEEYNALNRGYKITLEIVAESGFDDLMTAARATGTAPDIYDINHNYVSQYAERQEILPLDGLMPDEAIDNVQDNLRSVISYDGKLYGYPQFLEFSNVLFYRTDLMEVAGIDEVPTTWEEWKTAAEKMTTAETFGLTIPSWGEMTWTMWGWMLAEGHLALTDNWDAPNIKDYRDTALFIKSLYDSGAVPAEALAGHSDIGPFGRGETAMALSGSWGVGNILNEYPDIADKFGVTTMPTKDGDPTRTTTCFGGYSFVIDAKTEHAEGCADFLNWMLNDAERMGEFFELAQFGKTGATKTIAAWLDENYGDNTVVQTMNALGVTAQSEPLYPWDITMVTGVMFENVASGSMEVDDAIAQAEADIQLIIESQGLAGKNPNYQPAE